MANPTRYFEAEYFNNNLDISFKCYYTFALAKKMNYSHFNLMEINHLHEHSDKNVETRKDFLGFTF